MAAIKHIQGTVYSLSGIDVNGMRYEFLDTNDKII